MKRIFAICAALGCVAASWGGVQSSQTITLKNGWNAFYLTVTPDETPDALFADWPVAWVSAYDQAAFLATKQYSGTDSTEGAARIGYRIWRRDDPGGSSLPALVGNAVYICVSTNTANFTATIYGRPVAPRITWHPSSTNETMNLVGFALGGGSSETTIMDYFDGLDTGPTSYYTMWSMQADGEPKLRHITNTGTIKSGEVLIVDAARVSDWSGVLFVSPMNGIDFSTDKSVASVLIRNDGAKARTAQVSISAGAAASASGIPTVPLGLQIRDATTQLTRAAGWTAFQPSVPFSKNLAAGETMTLQIAVDRTKLSPNAGDVYGGLLHVVDADGGSGLVVTVPIDVTSDGGASAKTAWPKGVWLATATLNSVNFFGPSQVVTNLVTESMPLTNDVGAVTLTNYTYEVVGAVSSASMVPARGKMKIRLPMSVDADGQITLLQSFVYGTSNAVRRVSSAFLPIDQPKIPAMESSVFATDATFKFTVGETSAVNPMRHAFHPMHDGLKSDFKTPTPSGDDFDNYVSVVKPELFSVTNTVQLVWDATEGTAWSPDETLSGTITWEFDGLRHEGTVRAKGTFVMKRIATSLAE